MLLKIILLLTTLVCCECIFFSSFWAPLFNPRILNYRVDLKFDPESGKNASEEYTKVYGYRGEKLIEDLGNGKGTPKDQEVKQGYGEVKFYYTYSGADKYKK